MLDRAHAAGANPSLILSSPLKRAVETAEIAARELGYEGRILRASALLPDAPPHELWSEIRGHQHEASILIAAHEPLLSRSASWMLGSAREMVVFGRGSLMRMDFETIGPEPSGILRWLLV